MHDALTSLNNKKIKGGMRHAVKKNTQCLKIKEKVTFRIRKTEACGCLPDRAKIGKNAEIRMRHF